MSDWRDRVNDSEWRFRQRERQGWYDMNAIYDLEARVFEDVWESFGSVDMDCAGEGNGRSVARQIVESHNRELRKRADD